MYKVLIIDDERHVRQAIRLLGRWEELKINEIVEASDGESALDLMRKEHFHIVLVDMKMPKMNGVEFLQIAKSEFSNSKYIVVSGYDDFEFTKQAIKYKVLEYILKPISEEELNSALFKAFNEVEDYNRETTIYIHKKNEELYNSFRTGSIYTVKKIINEYFDILEDSTLSTNDYSSIISVFKSEFKKIILIFYNAEQEYMNLKILNFSSQQANIKVEDARRYILNIVIELFRFIKMKKMTENENLYKIKEYIDKYYYKDIKLNTFSDMYFLNKDYLSKLFKEQFGYSIYEYVLKVRMEKAKEFLADPEVKISVISDFLGYKDKNYFSKAFKTFNGVSPTEFRVNNN